MRTIIILIMRFAFFTMFLVLIATSMVASACGSDSGAGQEVSAEVPEATVDAPTTVPAGGDDDDEGDHDDEVDHDDEGDHDDEDGSGLGAHEHGTAELSIAWIGADVAIDLISPTFNVFGFEYEPSSDEDLGIEMDRTEALSAANVMVINGEAECALITPVATEVDYDGSHSEITVSWLFTCENPEEISQVDVSGLFAEFPNFEDVDVQWISDSGQSSAELSSSDATISLQ